MNCNCDCHKEDAFSSLKKCEDRNKRHKKEIDAMKKKILALTVAVAVIGTLIGKEGLDRVLEYLETLDKVKQSTVELISISETKQDGTLPFYYATSPSPSTLGVFALTAMLPTKRRL
tara:strand:- start:258 stop:608 length:351 start_codon:yes stop_codon:yes gene_type:complete